MKIPVDSHTYNPSLSWEENYKALEKHHQEETTWMLEQIKVLEENLEDYSLPDVWHHHDN